MEAHYLSFYSHCQEAVLSRQPSLLLFPRGNPHLDEGPLDSLGLAALQVTQLR